MSAAEPREIRLSEIPTELRNLREEAERWRAKWAQDTTELRKQVRELTERVRETATARDAARRTCDDLTEHCANQGRRIANLEDALIRAGKPRKVDTAAWISKRMSVGTPSEFRGDYRLVRLGADHFSLSGTEWYATGGSANEKRVYMNLEEARRFAAGCKPLVDVDAMEVA